MKFKCLIIMIITTFQILGMNITSVNLYTSVKNYVITEDTIYQIEDVDSIPVFSNKFEQDINIAISKELVWLIKYPQEAIEKNIYGKVHLTFVINSAGTIESIKVIRGVHSLIDNAAIQAISKLDWRLGRKRRTTHSVTGHANCA